MSPSMEKKASIIRVYDKVKVINPEFFVRCGYPKCQKDEMKTVYREFGPQIKAMICSNRGDRLFEGEDRLFEKVCREIAYARLRNTGFGGPNRSIYTERLEEHMGECFSVVGIRFCKTGEYYPPSRSTYESDDYDPGGLCDEKTHKILSLSPLAKRLASGFFMGDKPLMIEASNVEKASIHEDDL